MMRAILICFACLLMACNNNKCLEVECLNGGTCWDGECQCPKGFIGVNCDSLDPNFECSTVFECLANTYIVRANCTLAQNKLYNSTISPIMGSTNEIAFSNFDDLNFELFGVINGNEITVPIQINNGITYQGSGIISSESYPYSIELTYQAGNTACISYFTLN